MTDNPEHTKKAERAMTNERDRVEAYLFRALLDSPGGLTKEQLLERYAARRPQAAVVYVGAEPNDTHSIAGMYEDATEDRDGDWTASKAATVLVGGDGARVYVQINPAVAPEDAARLLRKIADRVERDPHRSWVTHRQQAVDGARLLARDLAPDLAFALAAPYAKAKATLRALAHISRDCDQFDPSIDPLDTIMEDE